MITLIDLILLLLACAGVTFTFVHAEIMDIIKLRPLWSKIEFFKKLFHCSFCTGNWVGAFYALSAILLKLNDYNMCFYIMTIPFASASFCFLWERLVILIDNKIIEQEKAQRK